MSIWNDLAAVMDGEVDAYLGDDVSYAIAGAPAKTITAFVITDAQLPGAGDYDPMRVGIAVKVAKALVPSPSRADRIQAARLGPGIFQPQHEGLPDDQGRYWQFPVQRVS